MKKVLLTISLLSITAFSVAQTCEEREKKLLEAVGSFSAAALYNTYATIGSISDAFGHDAYDAVTVSDLVTAQIKMMDNLINVMQGMADQKTLVNATDTAYAVKATDVLKGLKLQAQLLDQYADNRRQQKLNEYEAQRKKNWSAISKLMGIAE